MSPVRAWRSSYRVLIVALIGGAVVGMVLATVLGSVAVARESAPGPEAKYQPQSLLGRSPAEIGQYAIERARAQRLVAAGSQPAVVLVRALQRTEFAGLGLTDVFLPEPEPPLALVILRGEFDLRHTRGGRNLPPDSPWNRVTYIAWVFDLQHGMPVLMETSFTGGRFRGVLNDPSLPAEVPPGVDLQSSPAPLPAPPLRSSPLPMPDFTDPHLQDRLLAWPACVPGEPPPPSTIHNMAGCRALAIPAGLVDADPPGVSPWWDRGDGVPVSVQ